MIRIKSGEIRERGLAGRHRMANGMKEEEGSGDVRDWEVAGETK